MCPITPCLLTNHLSPKLCVHYRGHRHRESVGEALVDHVSHHNPVSHNPVSPNPFSERPSTSLHAGLINHGLDAALEEMDHESHMPDGCDPQVWLRMCAYRRTKIDREHLVSYSDG
jgi:hypothetical protein